ncbi:thioredoxin family protein, partial [Candidatus Sumerlaeota bacterium]|nr:thioredoxin family protein [Candidatus Sumerlaeota bacterium]
RLYCDAMKFTLVKPAKKGIAIPTPMVPKETPTPAVPYATPSPDKLFITAPTPVATLTPAVTSKPPTGATIQWLDNVLLAQQRAQQQNKGIFVYFFTDTAEECKQFESKTFADPTVASYISTNFIPLKFDMRMRPKEAYYLGAYRAPTIILYKSDGTPYRRIVGFKDAQALLKLIK